MSDQPLLDEVLKVAALDWVQPAWFAQAVTLEVPEPSAELLGNAGLGFIVRATMRGLVRPGDLTHDGFHSWEGTPNEVLHRVVTAWLAGESRGWPADTFWLELTAEGRLLVPARISPPAAEDATP